MQYQLLNRPLAGYDRGMLTSMIDPVTVLFGGFGAALAGVWLWMRSA